MTDHTDGPERTDAAQHLSTDTIADLQEGLLAQEPARTAREHLARCPVCAAEDRALAGVPHLLASADDAGPVPADVARRLDEAIAAEPAVRPAGTATVTALAPGRDGARQVRGMRVLQAAAVLVVLLAGAGLAVTAWGGGDDAGTTVAGSTADKRAAEALPGAGTFPVTTSGRNWTEDSVVAAVPGLLNGSLTPAAPSSRASDSGGGNTGGSDGGAGGGDAESGGTARLLADNPAGRLAGGPPLAECVAALNDGPVTPLAVDLATWAREPAAVVVLPTPGDPATVDEWVVAPDCSLADAKVLFFARVARP